MLRLARLVALLAGPLLGGAGAVTLVSACDSSSTSPPAASSADAGALGDKCAQEPTVDTCATCCGHTKTVLQPYLRGYQSCACTEGYQSRCASTICAATPTEPDTACEECINEDQTIIKCEVAGNEECDKDPACSSFRACDQIAQCLFKPTSPDGGQ